MTTRKLAVLPAALLAVCAVTWSLPDAAAEVPRGTGYTPAIAGGHPASTDDYPWMMALSDPEDAPDLPSNQSCGGMLVTPTKVVTAAHCAWETVPADIAVLTLDAPMPYPTLPLADAGDHDLYEPGTSTTILGWGWTSHDDPNSPVLQQATVPIRADADCAAYAADQGYVYAPTAYACTGDERGTVHVLGGDSGGPLLVDGRLAGVASWMPAPDHGGRSMFTRVTTYADDVAEHLD